MVPSSTAAQLRPLVDEFVVLEEPEFFYAVSQFFADFTQVSDEEVLQIFSRFKSDSSPSFETGDDFRDKEKGV